MIPGQHPKSVTMEQNYRSRSAGIGGHDQTECAVSLGRNMQKRSNDRQDVIDCMHDKQMWIKLNDKTPLNKNGSFPYFGQGNNRVIFPQNLDIVG